MAARIAGAGPGHDVLAGFAEGEEDPVQIDRKHAPIGVGAELGERTGPAADPGIGDHRVDAAHLRHRLGHAGRDRGLVGDVDHLGQHMDAGGLQPGLGIGVLGPVGAPDDHVGAGLGERLDHAETDAAIAARDQRHLALQIKRRIGHDAFPSSLEWLLETTSRVGACSSSQSRETGTPAFRRHSGAHSSGGGPRWASSLGLIRPTGLPSGSSTMA